MDALSKSIFINKQHWDEMISDVVKCLPNEACGFIAGENQCAVLIYPIVNIEQSPTRFRFDPHQQLEAMLAIEAKGLEILAIYHSHPAGPSYPSITDINEAAYPDLYYLIWFIKDGEWCCRGFIIKKDDFEEIKLAVVG